MPDKKIGMAIHAGAGPDSEFVREHQLEYEQGLAAALEAGYAVIEKNGSAFDAVEASVRAMEDNYIFNAGRGSALNSDGNVQMYASIMDGKTLKAGAGCLLTQIKNPVTFARKVLEDGNSVFMGGPHALEFAKEQGVDIEPISYFITDLQVKNFLKKREELKAQNLRYNPAFRGTVGAVAFDRDGNVAAATSTGGTIYSQPGRIGDTSMIGVGTYANNEVCAVSCTGDGEVLIRHAMAHSVYSRKEYMNESMQEVCENIVKKKLKDVKGDIGVISIDIEGNIGIAFNTPRMHRAWKSSEKELQVKIYP